METNRSHTPDALNINTSLPGKDMVWISGGTFKMGSDKHYPEEAPVHRVSVDGFWMDRTPVTNRQFRKFVNATGHITCDCRHVIIGTNTAGRRTGLKRD